ncbi:MAG: hypothetical protein CMM46_00735 [Rhodospirillaceae bacterium]|nr:hypothetical protein [Rhodospirillaceae bacterium]|tara:strand:- start:165 stop:497 length:333 start_codon:yes stop_codon:yes gene_type:complete
MEGMLMLPIVDMSSLATDDRATREAVAQQIGTICESVGFLYIRGHGVSDDLIASTRDVTERFFDQPDSIKAKVTRPGIWNATRSASSPYPTTTPWSSPCPASPSPARPTK